jgi:hypothetical protein
MAGRDDVVQIRRHELQQILEEIRHVVKLLDELAKERPMVFMIKARLETLLDTSFDEKTPVRPPSQAAMEAFTATSNYNPDGTKKKK